MSCTETLPNVDIVKTELMEVEGMDSSGNPGVDFIKKESASTGIYSPSTPVFNSIKKEMASTGMNSPKLQLGRVFKTPMTYSPRLIGNKPVPSPSRIEIWREQMGLDDDPDTGRCTSDSDMEVGESTPSNKVKVVSPKSPCTFVEYQTLKKELEERNSQRDELAYKLRTWMERTKQYKKRLEKEETTRRQQVKIMRKTHSSQLEEKDRLVQNLEDIIEEYESKIELLESQGGGRSCQTLRRSPRRAGNSSQFMPQTPPRSPRASNKLLEEVKRLQEEKAELTKTVENLQCEVDLAGKEQDGGVTALQEQITQLKQDKEEFLQQITKLKNQVQSNETGPCTTDNEKQIDKLELENEKLVHQVADLRHNLKTNSAAAYIDQLQRSNLENQRLQEKLDSMEEEMITKSEENDQALAKVKSENLRLLKEKQFVTQQMRQTRAEMTALQAREPEVVTKVRRVEVEVDSDHLKKSYKEVQAANEILGDQIKSLESMCSDLRYKLTDSNAKNSTLEKQVMDFTNEISEVNQQMAAEIGDLEQRKEEAVVATKKEMELKFRSLRTNYEKLRLKLSLVHPMLMEVIDAYKVLKKQCHQFPHLIQSSVEQVQQEICCAISEVSATNKDLVRKYKQEMSLRKKFHNELVELKGNIRVFCRVRPRNKDDLAHPLADVIVNFDTDDDMILYVANKGRKHTFDLDKVFKEDSTQTEVFEEVKALVTSCLDGFNVCIFAYGQTGSGKTYTMEGPKGNAGINQRALRELFDEVNRQGLDWTYTISVSVMEIYNEAVRDLLSNDPSYKLDVKMSSEGGYHVPGLTSVKVDTVSDVNTVFSIGQRNRATAATNMNEHSSRSHALLCVTVVGVNKSTQTVTSGKLNLVDLAGSERVSKSGADGARLKEAQNINKSLSSLGDVIHALRTKQNFVPYRNSKLTYLLQDSLKGDSKTLMIVQVAPTERHVSETLCSLNFAQRVRNVELGTATRRMEAYDSENIGSPMSPTSPQRPLTKTTSCSALSPSNRGFSQSNAISANRIAHLVGQSSGKKNSPGSMKSPNNSKNPLSRAVTPLLKPIRRKLNIHN